MTTPEGFPTRQYSYRGRSAFEAFDLPIAFKPDAAAVYRFHMGRDTRPALMSLGDISSLHDSFARDRACSRSLATDSSRAARVDIGYGARRRQTRAAASFPGR